MNKNQRHSHILKIIDNNQIESQHHLIEELHCLDIQISQSTLSKDLKELGIIKIRSKDGGFRLLQTREKDVYHSSIILKRTLIDFIRSMKYVGNLVLLKTIPGNASGLSKCVDDMGWPEVAGTLASVDTVLVVCGSELDSRTLIDKLNEIMN